MLLQQKTWCEGAFALAVHAGMLVDAQAHAPDPQRRRNAALQLEFRTPVVKSWSAEWCCKANDLAIQILGGYGYTRDYPVEQYYRDNRLNPIHEGSNGIQALDLLGRKALMDNGAALQAVLAPMRSSFAEAQAVIGLEKFAAALERAVELVTDTSHVLAGCIGEGKARLGLANASCYMTLVGHTLVAWVWLQQAIVASRAIDSAASQADRDFYQGKLTACRFFFVHELPIVEAQARLLRKLDDTTLMMHPEHF